MVWPRSDYSEGARGQVTAGTGGSAQWRRVAAALDSQQGGRAVANDTALDEFRVRSSESDESDRLSRIAWERAHRMMQALHDRLVADDLRQRTATAEAVAGHEAVAVTVAAPTEEFSLATNPLFEEEPMQEELAAMRAEMAAERAAMREEEQRMRAEIAAEWAEMTAERAAMREEGQRMQAEMASERAAMRGEGQAEMADELAAQMAAMREEEKHMQADKEAARAAEMTIMRGEGQRGAEIAMQAAAAAAGQQQTSRTRAIFADEARGAGLEEVEEVVT
jgi:hypothetical protein